MNFVFACLVVGGLLTAMVTGRITEVNQGALTAARSAADTLLGLLGLFTLWLGVARVAEKSGLLKSFTGLLEPLVRGLFPSIPRGHPALGAILMNLSANLFGFGSAATPFGLKAMAELQKLNPNKTEASEAMCTFLALNTSGVTLFPATIVALRANAGAADPADIVGTALFATSVSTCTALVADWYFRRRAKRGR
ncbi:MAG TPA: spore maturation protein [Clostridia bacterium]|nr:spore maturation protein [Clostridia bacterium]